MRALLPLLGLLLALPVRGEGEAPSEQTAAPGGIAVVAPAAPATGAVPAAGATRSIVQQRLPDGSIVLTDRPLGEAQTLRTWQFEREDEQAAAERRAAAQREAAAVSERIERRLEQQREIDRELEMARLQAAQAAAEREAALARAYAEAEPQHVIVWPHRGLRPYPHWKKPPHHRPQPPGVRPPRQALPPGHSLQRKAPGKPLGPNRHLSEWPY